MELTAEGLKERKSWQEAKIRLPEYDIDTMISRTKESPTWLHFGAGNIFRIFAGSIADDLLEAGVEQTGIVCAETFDMDIIDQIYKPHDNLLLGVTLRADGSTDRRVIASLAEALKADRTTADYGRLKEIIQQPKLQMLSFTITEKGYALKDTEENWFPWILGEVENGPEQAASAMGICCALLYERYKAGALPLAVVSMDNCSHNGEKLQNAIVCMAKEWEQRGYVETGFMAYLSDETKVSFPWSMIDKITPRPADSICEDLERIGVENMKPVITSMRTFIAPYVNAEGPQYLVIEDKFPNGRPALEKAGVYLTDRDTVNKVERMKVTTCLNPLHTALAVYGCMLGYALIADEMKDEELKKLVYAIGPGDGMEVVTDPGIISPEEFVREVIEERFPNPFVPDAPQRIATDTSQKVGIRYGETIKAYVGKYGDAKKLTAIPLAIAGWCRYLLGVDDNGEDFELSDDPMLDELRKQLIGVEVGKPESYSGQLKPILCNANIFGCDLYEAGIGEKIETLFTEQLAGPGAVRATLKKYL